MSDTAHRAEAHGRGMRETSRVNSGGVFARAHFALFYWRRG